MVETVKKSFCRLPLTVIPCHYDLTLIPNLEDFVFTGSETIDLEIKESTNIIVLNARKLIVTKAIVLIQDKSEMSATTIELSKPNETVKLIFPNPLPVGKTSILNLEFTGTIDDDLKGLYRTQCTGPNGEPKNMIVTQFESTDARSCFPCWDEPSFKSTFDITLKIPSGLTALSNMPIKCKNTIEAIDTINFERTVIMSTYLIAIAVGELDYIESCYDKTLLRVYTSKNRSQQGKFALDVMSKSLPYYQCYFDIEYPLPKLDLIAVKDLSFGAMENWGLMTFRDSDLLMEPTSTSSINKQYIALMITHEIAHQWFGNLVTMKWWTHLWLNEGYATFMEFLCVDHIFPNYGIWNQFVTEVHAKALSLDALKNSHPIEVNVDHPSEINEVFDTISYRKGASIIRMLHSFIGDECFRLGMNKYLNNHKYSNAETNDLWKALESVSVKPIEKIMSTWTRQQGFPLINIKEEKKANNQRILTLTQQQFNDPSSKNFWYIPITIVSESNPREIIFNGIMDKKNYEIVLDGVLDSHWIKINSNTMGFYRTSYDDTMFQSLLPAIKNSTLPLLDKLGIYDDYVAFVQAGLISTVRLFRLMQFYGEDDNYMVWSMISDSITMIRNLLSNTNLNESFKKFTLNLFDNLYKKYISWVKSEDESHLKSLFRMLILKNLVQVGHKLVITESKIKFNQHVEGKVLLDPDIRGIVYRAVLIDANTKDNYHVYQTMMKLYDDEHSNEEKERILGALGTIEDESLLSQVLDFIITDKVTIAGTLSALSGISSFKSRILAWEFFKKNWNIARLKFVSGLVLPKLVMCLVKYFVGKEYAKDVAEFFRLNPTSGIERTVQQCMEEISNRTDWLDRDKHDIEEYFCTI